MRRREEELRQNWDSGRGFGHHWRRQTIGLLLMSFLSYKMRKVILVPLGCYKLKNTLTPVHFLGYSRSLIKDSYFYLMETYRGNENTS